MTEHGSDLGKYEKEHDSNSTIPIPESAIFSYYRDDDEEGALQVKWTVRVANGAEAQRLDERQNQAIRELLTWACRRQRA
jgi:hypothetical protein